MYFCLSCSLRVRVTQASKIRDDLPGALLDDTSPATSSSEVTITETEGRVRNGNIEARVTLKKGRITFHDIKKNKELLAEAEPHIWINGRVIRSLAGDSYKIEANFQAYEGERLYGLGQVSKEVLDVAPCSSIFTFYIAWSRQTGPKRLRRGSLPAQFACYHPVPRFQPWIWLPVEQSCLGTCRAGEQYDPLGGRLCQSDRRKHRLSLVFIM